MKYLVKSALAAIFLYSSNQPHLVAGQEEQANQTETSEEEQKDVFDHISREKLEEQRPELGNPEDSFDWVSDHGWLEWFFGLSKDERLKMAKDDELWNDQLTKYEADYFYLLEAQEEMVKADRREEMRRQGNNGIPVKSYGATCEFNYECET